MREDLHLMPTNLKPFINDVRQNECLWDTDNEHYKDRSKTFRVWKEIAKKHNVTENIVRAKWKNLRDLFRREVRKYSPASVDEYQGRWKYFKSMWFLYRRHDFVAVQYNLYDDTQDKDEFVVKVDTHSSNNESDVIQSPDKSHEEFEVMIEEPRMNQNDDDYDMMFLKSLAPYFKQLGPVKKLVVRSKIQEILLNELGSHNYIM